jgi:integrase
MRRLNDAIHIIEAAKLTLPVVIKAIKLLIFTGCRRNEILTLTWEEVDFERKCLRLKDSKTGKKLVPLSDIAISIIKTIPKLPINPYVIANEAGTGHLVCIKKTWAHIRKLAGLPDLRIHDLRHNFASVGVCDNMSLAVIGKLLGHSNTSTTERYAHLQADPLRQAANQISNQIEQTFLSNSN